MKLTADEHRALAFIAALLCLSAAVRVVGLPDPVDVPAEDGFDLGEHIATVEAAVAEAEEMERPLAEGETVDPNTASAVQLNRLPRVGPALAERIVADREANGRFRRLADLGRVAGVGERTLELLAPHVSLPSGGFGKASGSLAQPPWGNEASGRTVSAPAHAADLIDLNRATAAELEALSGIGPVLAERIVAYRDSVGRFTAPSELARVPGIGPATLERLSERVTVRPGG